MMLARSARSGWTSCTFGITERDGSFDFLGLGVWGLEFRGFRA